MRSSLPLAAGLLLILLLPSTNGAAAAQDISYTFSGVVRVLDLSSPPPGGGPLVPGLDPLGMDGAIVLLSCVLDQGTAPFFTGTNGDGHVARYNAGQATLAITGSVGGGVDGTYFEAPCSVRVDDFPVGSSYGGDTLSVTTHWNLGLPFPDEFQVPFAELGQGTFTGIGLQPFTATEVVGFIGVNFAGSGDVFYFDTGTGIATGVFLVASPAERVAALIQAVEDLPGLNKGRKRSLTAKLENALRLLEEGRTTPAVRLLGAFIHRVRALVQSGKLEASEGAPLIDEAEAVIAELLAGAPARSRR